MEKNYLPADQPLEFTTREGGLRLDAALAEALPGSGLRARRRLWIWCRVQVNGVARGPAWRVAAGDRVRVEKDTDGAEKSVNSVRPVAYVESVECVAPVTPAAYVAANREYAALYKPAGMHSASLAGGQGLSLEDLLPVLWPHRPQSLCLLTRLDLGTSGIVLAAFSAEAAQRFRVLEAAGGVEKYYFALLRGDLRETLDLRRTLDTADRKKTRARARDSADPTRWTRVVPLRSVDISTLLRHDKIFVAHGPGAPALDQDNAEAPLTLALASIRRGARHQIRAHLAAAGFALYGDPLYDAGRQVKGLQPGYSDAGGPVSLYLHHAAVRFPGFAASAMPGWNLGEKEEDLPFSENSVW